MAEGSGADLDPRGYAGWLEDHEGSRELRLERRREVARLPRPRHVTIMAVPGPDGVVSRTGLDSILLQDWGAWDVWLLGERPAATGLDRVLAAQVHMSLPRDGDSLLDAVVRINRGLPRRDLVLVLPDGVELRPDALLHVGVAAAADPRCDLLYWDDDVIGDRGPSAPRFRPSWSPELLLSHFYLGSSFAFRARLLQQHGLRTETGDAAWWDFILRANLSGDRVLRVPRVLSRLRHRDEPLTEAHQRVLSDHVATTYGGQATVGRDGGVMRLHWQLSRWPTVTVVIPTRHNRALMSRALGSIARAGYEGVDVIVVDNGERSGANEAWYAEGSAGLAPRVIWWDAPFNYSAVNNAAAREATGEVLLFLNDDTHSDEPGWMHELVGWAVQPGIGEVGAQLTGIDGRLRHGGVVVGLNGFADHLFAGMDPAATTLLGPIRCYRNLSAVTAACVAVRRSLFEEVGGFDERFELCGSDVGLGLDLLGRGHRNVCTPYGGITHVESATRGSYVPAQDFAVSFWRYQVMLRTGDPFFSPNLSLESTTPVLRGPAEATSMERVAGPLGRSFETFRQNMDPGPTRHFATQMVATRATRDAVRELHTASREPLTVRTVNWFLPGIDSPFYGGWNTILRIIDHLESVDGVSNRLLLDDPGPEGFVRAAITAAFPRLSAVPIHCTHDPVRLLTEHPMPADAGIATHWTTAYRAAAAPGLRRIFYLIQDFEPLFYPAGTMYALAEETYRLGLYGICNTENLLRIYRDDYSGTGMFFQPAVDRSVFHAQGRSELREDDPVTLFVYARPGHWRNCWEMASAAIAVAKERLGDRLRVVTAGSWASDPGDLVEAATMRHLGLLEYRATGALYREAQIGLTLTVSAHPSYLPLEVMACGATVVAFDNPAGHWLLESGENCLLTEMSVTSLADAVTRLVEDVEGRERLATGGLRRIDEQYSDWPAAISGIHPFLCDPEGRAMTTEAGRRPAPGGIY